MRAAMQYQDALTTYAYGMLRQWAAAEDVVQDALMVVMRKWEDFEPGSSMHAWVRTIVRLKTLEALRARKRETTMADERLQAVVDRSLEENLDESAAEQHRAMLRAMQMCMAELNERSVSILNGVYRNSMSYEKIAAAHRMTVEAVRKALYRLRRSLQQCTEKRLGSEEVSA